MRQATIKLISFLRPGHKDKIRSLLSAFFSFRGFLLGIFLDPLRGFLSQKCRLRMQEFRVRSQNGEDGIIAYIFSQIGVKGRFFVEIGVQDGRECNTTHLLIHRGWRGVQVEGDPDFAGRAKEYYRLRRKLDEGRIRVIPEYVTVENINRVLASQEIRGEIDLLSIDIDGNDYWIWEALRGVSPRLVVIEYNASFGSKRSVSVEYDPNFKRRQKHSSGYYHGASLAALEKLGRSKGYALVACDSRGVNAFFLRSDLLVPMLDQLSPREAYYPHQRRLKKESTEAQFEKIKHLPLVSI